MTKKVTMQQIADHLGVSKYVVSKALSGKKGVSEATKERVIQVSSQLGYFAQNSGYVKPIKLGREEEEKPNADIRQSVLVLMPNIRFQTRDSLYWGRILDGISKRLEDKGIGMVIVMEQNAETFMHLLKPEGILGMIGVGEIASSMLLEIHRLGVTMVLVDHEDPLIPSDTLFANNYDCMYRLTKHLIGIGHRTIGFVGNQRYSRSFFDRWSGFRSAMEEYELWSGEEHLTQLDNMEHYDEPIKQWLLRRKKLRTLPTALVCANDSLALDASKAALELGLSVPDDLSITGFDNIDDSVRHSPPLTTVNVPKESLGARAVDKLLDRIDRSKEPLEKILIAGEVIYRQSITSIKQ
ncbi:LacI family transcriptional regulator [Paenibacillus cellulosilyticus]|uniref:LacI family transcriptional regulator n=1 Tax=Paenibacillus cellulosilyticus TaxID=375489 RepID=A0A2V2YAN1_9BACL|nr:LacI family DNA-binding transcriptional regulator [Paenibacillus cellulosilyticus]PWV88426.1 LacI family transcriptional regulator [Paenibacillus cellulosilyticus]QKS47270.1 LacI family DNA-binding transcriptional regulator [Paenibacillus cellulosilyticus]